MAKKKKKNEPAASAAGVPLANATDGNDEDSPKLWERQEWDTNASYGAFHNYYLAMEVEDRCVSGAYRNYLEDKNKPAPKNKQASTRWALWSQGLDRNGKKLRGTKYEFSVPWINRAAAYDKKALAEMRDSWEERRLAIAEREYELGDKLYQRALEMLNAVLFSKTEDNGMTTIQPAKWGERDIAMAMEMASKLMRKGAGMPDRNSELTIEWRETFEQSGVDPEPLYQRMVAEIVKEKTKAGKKQD